MTRQQRGRRRTGGGSAGGLAAGATLAGLVFAGALAVLAGHPTAVLVVDNGGQLAAAGVATLACAFAAARGVAGTSRRSWGLLAGGVGCWTAGQAVWSVYEVGLGREVPFPSLADVGFLLFPVIAAAGLLRWLRAVDRVAARARDLLDGVVIAGSLLALSWATTLGSVLETGTDDRRALVLSLAYPVGDVVMATLVLLTLVRARPGHRSVQLLVAAGLGGLACADSAYVYLVNTGAYSSGNLISAGWLTGFLLIAAGARHSLDDTSLGDGSPHAAGVQDPAVSKGPAAGTVPVVERVSRLAIVLPYVPLLVAEITVFSRVLEVSGVPLVELSLGVALVGLVLARQLLALSENQRLLTELAAAQDQLRHLSLHDPLTGLPNRVLFTDRLEHALALHRHDGAGVAVLFCDVDDFKTVNDEMGHSAGDELLLVVADRFREILRPGDTVARLGGDEFAVLIEGAQDPRQVAERLVATIARPYELEQRAARVTLSVGIALADGVGQEAGPLLRQADTAMYAAKAAGKGRAVLFQELPVGWGPAVVPRQPSVADETTDETTASLVAL